jgi:hypothetical protein
VPRRGSLLPVSLPHLRFVQHFHAHLARSLSYPSLTHSIPFGSRIHAKTEFALILPPPDLQVRVEKEFEGDELGDLIIWNAYYFGTSTFPATSALLESDGNSGERARERASKRVCAREGERLSKSNGDHWVLPLPLYGVSLCTLFLLLLFAQVGSSRPGERARARARERSSLPPPPPPPAQTPTPQ